MSSTPESPQPLSYTRKVLIAVAISVAAILLTAFIYFTAQILILIFAGILFSVFLSAPADLLAKRTRLQRSHALGIVVAALFLLVTGGGYFMGYTVYRQGVELSRTLPGAMKQLEKDLPKYLPAPREVEEPATAPSTSWWKSDNGGPTPLITDMAPTESDAKPQLPITNYQLPATAPAAQPTPDSPTTWLADKLIELRSYATDYLTSPSFVKGAGGVVSSTFGLLGNIVIVLGIGLFFAIAPATYSSGALLLVPVARRARIAQVLSQIATKLQWWFVGQLAAMTTVGILALIGLKILGVPMAFTLAILAGLLNFVPYIGPFLAAVPAVLIAFAPHGDQTSLQPALAGYTILLYLIIQSADGWFFTPFYQKRAVNIPPALIILAQVIFSLLLGPIGLILATPILVTVLVLVRTIYIEDILGDSLKSEAAKSP